MTGHDIQINQKLDAARAMLAALKGIAECVDGGSEDIDDWCEQARAAIAQAEAAGLRATCNHGGGVPHFPCDE